MSGVDEGSGVGGGNGCNDDGSNNDDDNDDGSDNNGGNNNGSSDSRLNYFKWSELKIKQLEWIDWHKLIKYNQHQTMYKLLYKLILSCIHT